MTKFNNVEEQNKSIEAEGLASYNQAFTIAFRDRKKTFFEIKYGEIGQLTQNPYFSTTAGILNYRRTDWDRCGQCQSDVLKNKHLKAFFEKWDVKHLKVLTIEEMNDLQNDLEALKENVKYIDSIKFYEMVEFDRSFKD